MTNTTGHTTPGDTMYPLHTGSVLLDIATAQRNEVISTSRDRRRARLALQRPTTTPSTHPPKHPWWWGLARGHRTA